MAKLDELPPEIVEIIVRVDFDPTASPKFRYRDLKSFSRITPSFQSPSQRVLSERVLLSTAMAAAAWIESGSRLYVTRELEFRSNGSTWSGGIRTVAVQGAIRACRPGLEKLAVLIVNPLLNTVFEEPNLKGERAVDARRRRLTTSIADIKYLTLESSVVNPPNVSWNPSFTGLTDLTIALGSIAERLDTSAFDVILRTNRIQSLTLTHLYDRALRQVTSQIDSIGPHLKTLQLRAGTRIGRPQQVLRPPPTLFARCAVLQTLEIPSEYSDLYSMLLRLPNPSLRDLKISTLLRDTEVESILALPSMGGLKQFEWRWFGVVGSVQR